MKNRNLLRRIRELAEDGIRRAADPYLPSKHSEDLAAAALREIAAECAIASL